MYNPLQLLQSLPTVTSSLPLVEKRCPGVCLFLSFIFQTASLVPICPFISTLPPTFPVLEPEDRSD